MVQVSKNSQPKVWINGQYMPANKDIDGSWYVELDGKRVKVDPNDLFGMNSHLDNLNESFEKQKEFHAGWKTHWQILQGKATDAYHNAVNAYKAASDKYMEVTQGLSFSELEGSKKKKAKQFKIEMNQANSQKRRGTSDCIFYGRLVADEAYLIQDINNMQSLANVILEA